MNGINQPPPPGPPPQAPPDPYRPAPGHLPGPPTTTDGRAIASMVLGIVATVLCCLPAVGLVCGTIAIILFAKFNNSYKEMLSSGQTLGGRGMAIAGLVTGIIGAAFGLLYTIYYIVWVMILKTATSGMLWK
jgi:hypothetical protein